MRRKTLTEAKPFRRTALGLFALVALLAPASFAAANPPIADSVIVLKGATSAEGIAAGEGTTFYAGDLALGDIYRGDVSKGTASLFFDVPEGRAAVGMHADLRHELLFVAGGATGQGYVYETDEPETEAVYQLTNLANSFINDVTVTTEGAWFTNSGHPELYFVPVDKDGEPGSVETLALSGPAAQIVGAFNLNGIAVAADGETLIVAHSGLGALLTVDPRTGASAMIEGVSVPNVDGIVVKGDELWAVQNFINQVSRIQLTDGLASGAIVDVITSDHFATPTTAALFDNTLAVVNAKFATLPQTQFEVVLVSAR
jgi:sugar lactone lactonase YvrE